MIGPLTKKHDPSDLSWPDCTILQVRRPRIKMGTKRNKDNVAGQRNWDLTKIFAYIEKEVMMGARIV